MKMRRSAVSASLAGVLLALLLLPAMPASAHEIRNVGKYRFTVGFGVEPAYLDQKNFIQFLRPTELILVTFWQTTTTGPDGCPISS